MKMNPNKEQLRYVIANGNDEVDNILLLNVDGNFTLFEGAGGGAVEHLDYVTRWETFDARGGYVGIDASKDDKFLDNTIMGWANTTWEEHKKTGNTQIVNMES
jgi:hypothetical protein